MAEQVLIKYRSGEEELVWAAGKNLRADFLPLLELDTYEFDRNMEEFFDFDAPEENTIVTIAPLQLRKKYFIFEESSLKLEIYKEL